MNNIAKTLGAIAIAALFAFALVAFAGCTTASASGYDDGYSGGAYAGLTVGYGTEVFTADDTLDLADQSLFGGAYVGFGAVTSGGLYLGLEGDATLRDVKGEVGAAGVNVSASSNWLASIRARAGVPVGPSLFYVTAGPAFTESKLGVSGFGDDKQLMIGLAVGGGVEAELTNTVLIRLEGMHYHFAEEEFRINGLTADLDHSQTVVRVGVGFKLN